MGGACISKNAVRIHPDATAVVPSTPTSQAQAQTQSAQEVPVAATSSTAPVPTGQTQLVGDGTANSRPLTTPEIPAETESRRKPKRNLIKAIKDNNLSLIDELLKEGCNLEELGMWDNTPLLVACTSNKADAALRLIAAKADVTAKNEHQATPLHYASVEGNLTLVQSLLSAGKDSGGEEQVVKMVNCGLAKIYNRHLDVYGHRCPLASAAESGFVEVCSALLAARAELNAEDDHGRTPLWLASRHSRVGVAKLLIARHEADVCSKDKDGHSVLNAATLGGCYEELVVALLTHGVGDVNDTAGTPLRDAVKASKRVVVEALLTHGAAVNKKAPVGGATALHAACEKTSDESLVALLVRARADPSLGDASGTTAFDLLRRRGLPDGQIVSLLSAPAVAEDDGGTGGAFGSSPSCEDKSPGTQEKD